MRLFWHRLLLAPTPAPAPAPPHTLEEALEHLSMVGAVIEELEREGALAHQQREAADLRCAGEVSHFLPLVSPPEYVLPWFSPYLLARVEALAEI